MTELVPAVPSAVALERDIDAWVDAEVADDPESVPDFWYALGTSERLASWLVECGWRKG